MKKNYSADFFASLVVAIIAIPLSIGIAIASGTPPAATLLSAIIGGIVVGYFSGAPLAVSGPAAGLAVMVFQVVQEFGIENLGLITLLAGFFQLILFKLKTADSISKVPESILDGMLAAIGISIALGQIHVLLGYSVPNSFFESLLTLPEKVFAPKINNFILGILAIGIQIFWFKLRHKIQKIPAPLIALCLLTPLSLFFSDINRVPESSIFEHFQNSFWWQNWKFEHSWIAILWASLGLAFVASAESLLTARAIQLSAPQHKEPNLNRELFAQGLGNITSGFLGGIPITAVMVRSAANLNFGGKTRLSTILHGLWIFIFLILVPQVIRDLPLSVLASILVLTGWKLIHIEKIIDSLKKKKHSYTLFWALTVFGILIKNLLFGLIFSLIVFFILEKIIAKKQFIKK